MTFWIPWLTEICKGALPLMACPTHIAANIIHSLGKAQMPCETNRRPLFSPYFFHFFFISPSLNDHLGAFICDLYHEEVFNLSITRINSPLCLDGLWNLELEAYWWPTLTLLPILLKLEFILTHNIHSFTIHLIY